MALLRQLAPKFMKNMSCASCGILQNVPPGQPQINIQDFNSWHHKRWTTCGNVPPNLVHQMNFCPQNRNLGTYAVDSGSSVSLFRRIIRKCGIHPLREKKVVLHIAGKRLYLCSVELVDVDFMLKEFELEDTFYSWYRIVALHVWMVMCRLLPEGREGRFVRNQLASHMWDDLAQRAKRLTGTSGGSTKDNMREINDQFRAMLLAYDEGLAADDMVLAGALWRTFLLQKCDDPRKLEILLHYVHKQLRHLEFQESETIIRYGIITFLPMYGDKVNKKRNEPIMKEIMNRT